MRRALILPSTILCLGVALLLNSAWKRTQHNWKPASLPAPVNGSDSLTLAFRADQSITFDIDFEISGRGERFNCMLGSSNYSSTKCDEQDIPLDATWEVNAGGHTVASGVSRNAFGASWGYDGMAKTIGTFAAQQGVNYSVVVRFIKPTAPFASVAPTISIRADRQAVKNARVDRDLAELGASVILMIGFAWLFLVKARHAQDKTIVSLNR